MPASASHRNRPRTTGSRMPRAVGSWFLCGLCLALPGTAAGQEVPRHELDPAWPKLPLPDRMLTGGLGGMCVDDRGHVFALNRQNVVPEDLDGATLAPPIVEFDPDGNVVGSWGDPETLGGRLHDCHADADGNLWIIAAGTGVVQKYSSDGELLLRIGEAGRYDSSDGTRDGEPLNSDRAQFFLPASIDVHRGTGEVYVADGELPGGNRRIAVLSPDGRFLRQWPLHRTDEERDVTPVPHCLRVSDDGLVYVCDREADRIQVFDREGTFIRNIDVPWEPRTSLRGTTQRDAGHGGGRGVLAGPRAAVAVRREPEPGHGRRARPPQRRGRLQLRRRAGALPRPVHAAPRHRGRFERRRLRRRTRRPAHPEVPPRRAVIEAGCTGRCRSATC